MEQKRAPRIRQAHTYTPTDFQPKHQVILMGTKQPLNKYCLKTWIFGEEMTLTPYFILFMKINLIWIIDLNIKTENVKFLGVKLKGISQPLERQTFLKQDIKSPNHKRRYCPDWYGSVDWAPACKPKGHRFDSQSGYIPGLRARFPVGVCEWQPHINITLSVSLSSLLSKNRQINLFQKVNYI